MMTTNRELGPAMLRTLREVEDVLLWLVEREIGRGGENPCVCGHDFSDHTWPVPSDETVVRLDACRFPASVVVDLNLVLCNCEQYRDVREGGHSQ